MKAQQRHELHTNELAQWLESAVDRAKPYSRAIVGAILAAAIIFGVYAYVSALQRRTLVSASDEYISALQSLQTDGPRELQAIVEDYRGTEPAVLAQLVLAESQLNQGTNELYINKPAGRENLAHAAGAFTQVQQATKDPMLRAWAIYGLARAHESMGDLDRARSDYQKLITEYPNSSLVASARTHLTRLNETSVKEFYDWFARQDPHPPGMEKDSSVPGLIPRFDLSEPSSPDDLKLLEPAAGTKASTEAPAAESKK